MKLGNTTTYPTIYDPNIIDAIPRLEARQEINYDEKQYEGSDLWTIYEFSHLDKDGKPNNAILSLEVPQSSKFITESKSLKLYFNSLNLFKQDFNNVIESVARDITKATNCKIVINQYSKDKNHYFRYLDSAFYDLDQIKVKPSNTIKWTKEKSNNHNFNRYHTSLFRSHCPVTNQPDWASIFISIKSSFKINEEELLNYLISFREHQAFHENCVEEIITHLNETFECSGITVYARFTRRGGIDINPFRKFGESDPVMEEIFEYSRHLQFWDPRQ